MSEEVKPDAWIAWHEKGKPTQARFSTFHYDKGKCEKKLTDHFYNKKRHKEVLQGKLRRGWKIRPVKLQFLDEEGEA